VLRPNFIPNRRLCSNLIQTRRVHLQCDEFGVINPGSIEAIFRIEADFSLPAAALIYSNGVM